MVGPLSHRRALPAGGYCRLSRQSVLTTCRCFNDASGTHGGGPRRSAAGRHEPQSTGSALGTPSLRRARPRRRFEVAMDDVVML